jgi:hypothetical protein
MKAGRTPMGTTKIKEMSQGKKGGYTLLIKNFIVKAKKNDTHM